MYGTHPSKTLWLSGEAMPFFCLTQTVSRDFCSLIRVTGTRLYNIVKIVQGTLCPVLHASPWTKSNATTTIHLVFRKLPE